MSLRERLQKSTQRGRFANQYQPGAPTASEPLAEAQLSNSHKGEKFEELKTKIHSKLVENLNLDPNEILDESEVSSAANQFLEQYLAVEKIPMSRPERETMVRELVEEILGLGPLEPLLKDPYISDILVNGPKNIYIERNGKLHKSSVTFKDDAHLMHIIDRMVSAVGRRIDEKTPMVDARLKDGSRVNAIIPPLALDGASISIRKFKRDAGTMEKLLNWKSLTPYMALMLEASVRCRQNIIISGGTGAGKTTLLNSLSACIPEDERIVTIEDSAELQLQQDHVVRLETRPPNIEGEGAIPARQLVINSLRMRPDRIVVGECRGPETLDMLQAMNTGHDGSLTTLHANSPRDALSRIETMCMMNNNPLPALTIKQQIASAVHIIVQASRLQDGSRKVTSISEIIGMEGEVIAMQEIFKFEQLGLDDEGRVIGRHVATGIRPRFADLCRSMGVYLPLDLFDPKSAENLAAAELTGDIGNLPQRSGHSSAPPPVNDATDDGTRRVTPALGNDPLRDRLMKK
ncbi:MAG: CpaF family protein [Candidatus Melainabacteria bacterium]|nr:CpaF family protein [Candidatus Melainabacteria bacterium]